jgi:hypothetical protein
MHADGLRTEKLPDGKVRRVDHRLGLYLGPHLSLSASHSLGAEVPATSCIPWMGFAVSRRWDESSTSSARETRSRESANKDQEGRGIGRFRGMMRNHAPDHLAFCCREVPTVYPNMSIAVCASVIAACMRTLVAAFHVVLAFEPSTACRRPNGDGFHLWAGAHRSLR